MKFSKFLEEERVSSVVKRSLLSAIKRPKKNVIVVNDKEVIVKPEGSGVSFTFDQDMYELSMTITDLIDTIGGYKQKIRNKGKMVVFTVQPQAWGDTGAFKK